MATVICDTHVHCYDFAEFEALLDYAYDNMAKLNQHEPFTGILFFTNSQIDRSYKKIQASIDNKIGQWSLENNDNGFIQASRENKVLYLAPARQLNSAQRLEFLLLGCDEDIDDGMDSAKIIEQYSDQYAVICPWGVGKWLGKRGKLLSELLQQYGDKFLLGDNGGRPWIWFHVPHFKQTNLPIINGSDPLPISGEIKRTGSFCVSFDTDSGLKLSEVIEALKCSKVNKTNLGRLYGLITFLLSRAKLKNQNTINAHIR